jgi:TonB-dependent SusC/RagA subfamily outer membrane receptor
MNLKKPLPWVSVILTVIVLMLAGFADEDARYRKILTALQKFSYGYPQQKVFLHLDREQYRGGESLWFKAYLVNALNGMPDTLSTNLYVELIGPGQSRIEIKRLQMSTGFGKGDFRLSDTLPEGQYQLRAYTNWMQNFDPAFYFTRNFQLSNPGYSKLISPRQARSNRKEVDNLGKLAVDIDLQFMPEGGKLVTGLESVVGFKAVNKLGLGVPVQGSIVDDQGKTTTAFSSFYKGMGTFSFTPEKGRKYAAVIPGQGKEFRFSLPEAEETGLVMQAEDQRDRIVLSLRSNRPPTNDPVAREVILAGQSGGTLYYHHILTLEKGEAAVTISKSLFPGGIMQLTVFSGRGEPVAERLVFINRIPVMRIQFKASDTLTEKGTKINLDLITTDLQRNPLPANLSLAITRATEQDSSGTGNIISNLLLTSDLKGYVEDPAGYFRDQSSSTLKALDNLMLTQGWRRFDWNRILAGDYPKILYEEEKGLTLSGQITNDLLGIPLKNCKVQLSIMDAYNDVFTQQTSKKGYFLFENLVYYDTISVKLEAWRPSGRRNLVIVLPDERPGGTDVQHGGYQLTTLSERDNRAYRFEKSAEATEAYKKELVRQEQERRDGMTSIYGKPDYVLRSEDFPKGGRNILEVIQGRILGVNVTGDQVQIRGPNSIAGGSDPLFLIDGLPTHDVQSVLAIPVEDIDRVEVLKGTSAAIYGARAANGVIAIYTKHGQFVKRGVVEFDMLGYSKPRQFYQPKYNAGTEPQHAYTLLWIPEIRTGSSGKARIVFDKPGVNGDYRFIIQGLSLNGHPGVTEAVISSQ